jgi:proteic killer suppression protein
MIKSFKHKGLQDFFESGTKKGIIPEHSQKIARILDRMDASGAVSDMNLPGFRLHELSGNEKGTFSVTVNGNWRITFRFEKTDAVVVDYRDYH